MSNIGLSYDFKEVDNMLHNKSLSELKEGIDIYNNNHIIH